MERTLAPLARRAGPDWISAALELAALGLIVVAYTIAWALDKAFSETRAMEVAFSAMPLGSGIGWLHARRPRVGGIVALVRAFATIPYAYYAVASLECENQCSSLPYAIVLPLVIT